MINNLMPMEELRIGEKTYVVQPDPNMIKKPYVESGAVGDVIQVKRINEYYALKVFNVPDEGIVTSTENLRKNKISELPGLIAAKRTVISPKDTACLALLKKHPDLKYSILMPWMGGYTWFEILGDNKVGHEIPVFTENTSIFFAAALSRALSALEAKGLAHCDLCSNNIILDLKGEKVHLIDIEEMLLPGITHPPGFVGGQRGYAHPHHTLGHQWVKESDRFGGGMLISEILSWFSPEVRKTSDAESYADPSELCKDKKKYDLMRSTLFEQGGDDLADLYTRLWTSKRLKDCPTLNEWDKRLDKIVKDRNVLNPDVAENFHFGPDGRLKIGRKLVSISGTTIKKSEPVIATARKIVDVGVHKKPSSTSSSPPSSLPNFQPATDWGKIIVWAIVLIIGLAICFAISTTAGGIIYINNSPSFDSDSSSEYVAPVIVYPTNTPRDTPRPISPTSYSPPISTPSGSSPSSSCSGVVVTNSSSSKGNYLHVDPCSGSDYDLGPLANGTYEVSPNDKFLVYVSAGDGSVYAAKIGDNTLTILGNLKRDHEFSAFYRNETPSFRLVISGSTVTIYEDMFKQNATYSIPSRISQ